MNCSSYDLAQKFLIFRCLVGSRAYGIHTEQSDYDYAGVFIAPPEYHLGALQKVNSVQGMDDDEIIYEIDRFVKLAADSNPNLFDVLFAPDCNILYVDDAFRHIRQIARMFLSKRIRRTFSGYAMAQLKRIKGHNKWISNPQPEVPPSFCNYCLIVLRSGETIKYSDEEWESRIQKQCIAVQTYRDDVFRLYVDKQHAGVVSDDGVNVKAAREASSNASFFGTMICSVDKFKEARTKWRQYWEWKKNRNPIRAGLEEKHGFDTKHAMHLVRLMRMAKEILVDGVVMVRRPDASELLAIRNGSMSYEAIVKWAEDMDSELERVCKDSSLPDNPNVKGIMNALMYTKMRFWKDKGILQGCLS